jgi:hypothetical protein
MSQQQQDELHAQTSEHDGCESVTETKRCKKAEYNRLYRLRKKLENNDECESVTEAKCRKRAEYQKQYRLSKKLEKESMLMKHDTN